MGLKASACWGKAADSDTPAQVTNNARPTARLPALHRLEHNVEGNQAVCAADDRVDAATIPAQRLQRAEPDRDHPRQEQQRHKRREEHERALLVRRILEDRADEATGTVE
jgi:hypothetical protein